MGMMIAMPQGTATVVAGTAHHSPLSVVDTMESTYNGNCSPLGTAGGTAVALPTSKQSASASATSTFLVCVSILTFLYTLKINFYDIYFIF